MARAKSEAFDAELQEFARLSSALAHPARLAILQFLASAPGCFSGSLSSHLPLSASTVSQHLTELKTAGFIQGTISGVRVSYCLRRDTWNRFIALQEKLLTTAFNRALSEASSISSCAPSCSSDCIPNP